MSLIFILISLFFNTDKAPKNIVPNTGLKLGATVRNIQANGNPAFGFITQISKQYFQGLGKIHEFIFPEQNFKYTNEFYR